MMWHIPTLDDFSAWIEWHLDKELRGAEQRVNEIRNLSAIQQRFHGGGVPLEILEAVHGYHERGINNALGEAWRASEKGILEIEELEGVTNEKLQNVNKEMKATAQEALRNTAAPSLGPTIEQEFEKFDRTTSFYLRQFSVGHFVPSEPEHPPSMKNDIRIENMHGGAIQQGTTNSKQAVSGQVFMSAADPDQLRDLVAQTKAVLPLLPETARADLLPIIDELETETTLDGPDGSKVSGLLQSIKTICEGVVGNVAASGIVAVITRLFPS